MFTEPPIYRYPVSLSSVIDFGFNPISELRGMVDVEIQPEGTWRVSLTLINAVDRDLQARSEMQSEMGIIPPLGNPDVMMGAHVTLVAREGGIDGTTALLSSRVDPVLMASFSADEMRKILGAQVKLPFPLGWHPTATHKGSAIH